MFKLKVFAALAALTVGSLYQPHQKSEAHPALLAAPIVVPLATELVGAVVDSLAQLTTVPAPAYAPQQYAAPSCSAPAAQYASPSCSAPAATYTYQGPSYSYSAPQTYAAPTYAPAQYGYAAPPVYSYAAPAYQTYAAPVYSAPAYAAPAYAAAPVYAAPA